MTIQPGEEMIVGERLRAFLARHRKAGVRKAWARRSESLVLMKTNHSGGTIYGSNGRGWRIARGSPRKSVFDAVAPPQFKNPSQFVSPAVDAGITFTYPGRDRAALTVVCRQRLARKCGKRWKTSSNC